MSRRKDQSASPGRPGRREKRKSAPALAPLEDRRLMSADLSLGAAPIPRDATVTMVRAADHGVTTLAAASPSLSFEGDYVVQSSSAEWVNLGSDAQFGPTAQFALHAPSGLDVAYPATGLPADPPVFHATTLPAFDGRAIDPAALPYTSGFAGEGATIEVDPEAQARREALDAAFAKLDADTRAVTDKSEVTPKLLATLRKASEKAAEEAGEPDAELVQALRDDALAVQESGTFTDEQQQRLKDGYTAVLKSAGVSDGTIAELFAAQDAVKAASRVTPEDLRTLAADHAAIQDFLDAMPQEPVSILPAFDGGPIAFSGREPAAFRGSWDGAGGAAGATLPAGQPVTIAATDADLAATSQPVTIAATDADLAATSQPVTIAARPGVVNFGNVQGLPSRFHQGDFEAIRQSAGLGLRQGGGLARRMTMRGGQGTANVVVQPGGSNAVARRGPVSGFVRQAGQPAAVPSTQGKADPNAVIGLGASRNRAKLPGS
ncbi:hypothetical protein [Paludisphaera soli]|uniref:hypothetical protein n=1 Tax=Paludisphaera soli TaxID=2712865 RepID=UPI0013EDDCD7|nr:hypothetical protein [Paludisphaera soli]